MRRLQHQNSCLQDHVEASEEAGADALSVLGALVLSICVIGAYALS